uniref:Sin3 C-terminal domain-containing protein n=1 Tax=Romanomermis culicivorax TaxID=13658 RepID=A0A915I393_ROMCU
MSQSEQVPAIFFAPEPEAGSRPFPNSIEVFCCLDSVLMKPTIELALTATIQLESLKMFKYSNFSETSLKIASTFEETTAYLPAAWYIFFRLHHLLAERLEEFHNRDSDEQYRNLIDMLKKLLTLEIDGQNFETFLKNLNSSIGWKFLIFEKIVVNCFRQLTSILNEEKSIKAYENYVDFYLKRGQFKMCDDEEEDSTSLGNSVNMNDLTKYEMSAQKLFGSQPYFKTTFHRLNRTVQFEIVLNRQRKVLERHQQNESDTSTKIANNSNNLSDYLPSSRKIGIKRIFLRRNLKHCKIQLSYKSILDNFIFDENLSATMNNNGRLNYVSQTYDFLIRKNHRNAEKTNLWRMSRQRMYHFLKWYKNWLNNNVTNEQMEAAEKLFTIGFVQPYSNKKSSNGCILRKISRHCWTRPFSYRRTLYVDSKRTEKMRPTIILDIDKRFV